MTNPAHPSPSVPTTTELPAPAAGASASGALPTAPAGAEEGVRPTGPVPPVPPPVPPAAGDATPPAGPAAEGGQPAAPAPSRPRLRPGSLIRMGPWAPAAGALLGLVAGLVAVVLLAGAADAFAQQLALVFLTLGLTMVGAAAALLADEVRLVRRGAREAGVRPAWVEATANLVNGLTPARLLLLAGAFVLFLAAHVS
jgi:hypothetical protein